MMAFDELPLQSEVKSILALDGAGERLLPLVCDEPSSQEAVRRLRGASAGALFPGALSPQGALAGLWLYFSCFDEGHSIAQDLPTPEGSYWHAILHRQEPDDWNSGYWFRQLGRHPVFEPLALEAARLASARSAAGFTSPSPWDPEAFIRFCSRARDIEGGEEEKLAREIQRAEWRLLFSWCARVRG